MCKSDMEQSTLKSIWVLYEYCKFVMGGYEYKYHKFTVGTRTSTSTLVLYLSTMEVHIMIGFETKCSI